MWSALAFRADKKKEKRMRFTVLMNISLFTCYLASCLDTAHNLCIGGSYGGLNFSPQIFFLPTTPMM